MKKLIMMVVAVVCATCLSASAAFTAPTAAQIAQAAANPAALATLLQGATAQQAADVVRVVVTAALGLGLSADALNTRIASIVSASFTAVSTPAPGAPVITSATFAAALGTSLGSSPGLSQNGAVIAVVETAVASAGGGHAAGAALVTSFSQALNASVAAHLPAKGYEIQQ